MNAKAKILGGALLITLLSACTQPTSSNQISEGSLLSVESINSSTSTELITGTTVTGPSITGGTSVTDGPSITVGTSVTGGTSTGGGGNYNEPEDTYNGSYYNNVNANLSGTDLKRALSTVTSANFTSRSYGDLWDLYPDTDVDGGKMLLFYTATPLSYSSGSATSKSNKEHVWPQSWYGAGGSVHSNGSPGADAHNVYPCDTMLNNVRGNSAFDELPYTSNKVYERGSSGTYGQNGGNLSYATAEDDDSYNYTNTGKTIFYPKKGYRGITARTLMYVATRYYNDSRYPVELVDVAQTSAVTGQYGRIGKLSTLLKWHLEEPVSDFEIARNEEIYTSWHHNRNPFIDKPSYACKIFGEYNDNTRSACAGYEEPTEQIATLDALINARLGRTSSLLNMLYISNNKEELEN